jgi:hypothetical protein
MPTAAAPNAVAVRFSAPAVSAPALPFAVALAAVSAAPLVLPLPPLLPLGLLSLFCLAGLARCCCFSGLLLLFRGLSLLSMLLVLSVRGSNDSEKKEQNARADPSNRLHACRLH